MDAQSPRRRRDGRDGGAATAAAPQPEPHGQNQLHALLAETVESMRAGIQRSAVLAALAREHGAAGRLQRALSSPAAAPLPPPADRPRDPPLPNPPPPSPAERAQRRRRCAASWR